MAEKPKIVVTNPVFPETRALLEQHATVVVNPALEPWPYEEVRTRSRDAVGLLAFMTDRIDAAFLAACPRLRVIGAALKGFDNIDVRGRHQRRRLVDHRPRSVDRADRRIGDRTYAHIGPEHRRRRSEHQEASDFMAGAPSFMGRAWPAQRLASSDLVLSDARSPNGLSDFNAGCWPTISRCPTAQAKSWPHVTMASFEDVISNSDYVVLALPLTADTRHIVNSRTIARMKPGARLVNPARGSLVDEAAVADAIASGQLSGYAADAFECEDWASGGSAHPHRSAAYCSTGANGFHPAYRIGRH